MDPESSTVNNHRLPPYNLDAEEQLLSAMSIAPSIIPEVREILGGPGDFYRQFHQDIYRAICDLADGCGVVDGITIHEELVKAGVAPDPGRLGEIFTKAIHAADATYHAGIVHEKARLRALIEAATATLDDIYGWQYTSNEVVAREARRISRIAESSGRRDVSSIVWARDVVEREIEWLWPGRIPLGKQTTLAGPGGVGKSFLLCEVAAIQSAGKEWPFSDGEVATPGNVLYVSGEDDVEDTLRPRLRLQGADLGRVAFLSPEELLGFNLSGPRFRDVADRAIRDMGGTVLIVIDPPSSFLAGIDENSNAEVRGFLTPIKEWAEKHGAAVIFNTHVNKGSGKKLEVQQRVIGSVAMVNGPRCSHMVTVSEDDPDTKLFVPLKNNVWQRLQALSFRIVPDLHEVKHAKLEWIGEVDIDAGTAMNGKDEHDEKLTNALAAERWLIEKFRSKQTWQSRELLEWAEEELGEDQKTAVRNARAKLGIQSKKVGPNWVCWVSDDWQYGK